MTAKETLYYGFGQVIYALALTDGAIQNEELAKLKAIVTSGLESDDLVVSEIIFNLLERESSYSQIEIYQTGINNMRLGDNYLDEKLMIRFVNILNQVAKSFPPKTIQEKSFITQFQSEFTYTKK